jgi:hypothetical protein
VDAPDEGDDEPLTLAQVTWPALRGFRERRARPRVPQ